jgi:hypothetical protein
MMQPWRAARAARAHAVPPAVPQSRPPARPYLEVSDQHGRQPVVPVAHTQLPVLVAPKRVQLARARCDERVRVAARHGGDGHPGEEGDGLGDKAVVTCPMPEAAKVSPTRAWGGCTGSAFYYYYFILFGGPPKAVNK